MATERVERRLAAIIAADVAPYSRLWVATRKVPLRDRRRFSSNTLMREFSGISHKNISMGNSAKLAVRRSLVAIRSVLPRGRAAY